MRNVARLISAAEKGDLKAVKELLANGANVHARYDLAVRRATENGHTEIAELLLDRGAYDRADTDGHDRAVLDELLLVGALCGQTNTVNMLLGRGNYNRSTADEARQWADEAGHTETAAALKAWAGKRYAPSTDKVQLHQAAEAGNIGAVRRLLNQGTDVNARDPELNTPAHVAASKGNTQLVKLLVERGAEINATNWYGSSVLRCAVANGHTDTAAALEEWGAVIDPAPAAVAEWKTTQVEVKGKLDDDNRGEESQLPPTAARICRVAAGLATWTPEEKAYLKDHLGLIAYQDQLHAAMQEGQAEPERKSNLRDRIDEAKNKTPENDERDRGPSLGGR